MPELISLGRIDARDGFETYGYSVADDRYGDYCSWASFDEMLAAFHVKFDNLEDMRQDSEAVPFDVIAYFLQVLSNDLGDIREGTNLWKFMKKYALMELVGISLDDEPLDGKSLSISL